MAVSGSVLSSRMVIYEGALEIFKVVNRLHLFRYSDSSSTYIFQNRYFENKNKIFIELIRLLNTQMNKFKR